MALFSINNISIKGIASCVPKYVEENKDISLFKGDESHKFILSTGIERRRIADNLTTTSDLCFHAAKKLLDDLEWSRESIDCLIFVTQTPDYILPATSCILQERLALKNEIFAIDVSLGCSGWIYGLSVIAQMISSTGMKRGLLLAGDTISKVISPNDSSTYPLFGDAGTATAIEFDKEKFPTSFHLASEGKGYNAIIIPDGGFRNQCSKKSFEINDANKTSLNISLNGMDVFSFGITKAPQSVNILSSYVDLNPEIIDYFIFHQANLFMNEKIRKKLKLPKEKVPYSLADFGNTSSATIPLTMTTKLQQKLQKEKLKNIACGFGVGLSWGSVCFETNKIVCPDLIEI